MSKDAWFAVGIMLVALLWIGVDLWIGVSKHSVWAFVLASVWVGVFAFGVYALRTAGNS